MEFFTFDAFISVPTLITAYYVGVIFIPLLAFLNREVSVKWVRFLDEKTGLSKWKLLFVFAFLFVCFQIAWRMMFEMMIGYFQMHEYLRQLAG